MFVNHLYLFPLPLPIVVEGGGASFIAGCPVLLELNMELMSAGFWLLLEPLEKDGTPWLCLCWGGFIEDNEALLNVQLSLLAV